MKTAISLGLTGLLAGMATSVCAAPASLALVAGAGRVDITPPASALDNGNTIHDPIYARAMVIGNGATCAVVATLDQGGVAPEVFADVSARITKASGCPAQNLLISATHTHSSSSRTIPQPGQPDAKTVADAVIRAASEAKARLKPARVGFGTTQVYFNTNRDVFDGKSWYQGVNREGPSDKTLAVMEVLGEDGLPIAVYMNYAMHAINFYLSGVISGDVPGAASRYLERRYPGAVAMFTQGASGDQNPLLIRPMLELSGIRTHMPDAQNKRIDAQDQWKVSAGLANAFTYQNGYINQPLPAVDKAAYEAALEETSDLVKAMGVIIGESAIDVMRNLTPRTWDAGPIESLQKDVACPGRIRLDESARQGSLPYKDGPDAQMSVGLLRIAGVHLGWVNGEIYSQIGMRMKREALSTNYMVVGLANKRGTSGYIGSNEAGSHLTFQIIGSKLKPGCAEDALATGSQALFAQVKP
jgi:neutral ceramidase